MRVMLLLLAFLMTPALAADVDPAAVPARGSVAPAFGLNPLATKKVEDPPVHELDELCGTRPGETTAVLLVFVGDINIDDLSLANTWQKKHGKSGLEVVGISTERIPDAFAAHVERSRLKYPVLDDRHAIVSHRYGVPKAPFSFLLDQNCRILGFSNRSLTEDQDTLGSAVAAQVSGQLGQLGR